jgi:hypothetical protein
MRQALDSIEWDDLGGAVVAGGRSRFRTCDLSSRADRVPRCARGVPPRRIFGRNVWQPAVVLGSLLHGCYMAGTLPAAAEPRRRSNDQEVAVIQ